MAKVSKDLEEQQTPAAKGSGLILNSVSVL